MKPLCKRCLLSDIGEAEYATHIAVHIKNLPENEKVRESLYQKRLSLCRTCDDLVNGMCKFCGCFVELRAAKKAQYCPAPSAKW